MKQKGSDKVQGNCYLCDKYGALHTYHVFQGVGRRKVSDKYKAVVPLCPECHEEAHKYRIVRLTLQEQMQRELMEKYGWNTQQFISKFGKNYL